jgi:hypothetical protein
MAAAIEGTTVVSTFQALSAGAALLPAGGYGPYCAPAYAFNAVAARTRPVRRHVLNREEVERARLRERRFGFQQYAEPGGLSVPDDKSAAMYAAETDRFKTDAAAEERDAREAAAARRAGTLERRREFYATMDQQRAAEEEAFSRRFVEETAALQADGRAAFKNRGGMPVNPITQEYRPDAQGEQLRGQDARMMARAAQRAQYLAEQGTGAADYDILSNQAQRPSDAVARLAGTLGVPVPQPVGVRHQAFVNASVTGPHLDVRQSTQSRPRLRDFSDRR